MRHELPAGQTSLLVMILQARCLLDDGRPTAVETVARSALEACRLHDVRPGSHAYQDSLGLLSEALRRQGRTSEAETAGGRLRHPDAATALSRLPSLALHPAGVLSRV
jgi:hypothetical protein